MELLTMTAENIISEHIRAQNGAMLRLSRVMLTASRGNDWNKYNAYHVEYTEARHIRERLVVIRDEVKLGARLDASTAQLAAVAAGSA